MTKCVIAFGCLFVLYFCSAAGLYNSTDAPQYFTGRSLLEHRTIDISKYETDYHYFVYPDIFNHSGKTYSVRGYLTSTISLPMHLLARGISKLYYIEKFPQEAINSPNFTNELAVTSLFTIFSVTGIFFLWKSLTSQVGNGMANLFTIVAAFGSYCWKYSATYSRQGVMVMLMGVSIYLVTKKRAHLIFIIWVVSFGIDMFLFIGYTVFLSIYYYLNKENIKKINKKTICISLLILGLQLSLNLYWYNSLISSQTHRQITVSSIMGDKAINAWISTPLFPTAIDLLFASGRLHDADFTNFTKLPLKISEFASVEYAKRYKFYGLFYITPLAIPALGSLILFRNEKYKRTLFLCWSLIVIGIVGNSKILQFWGGNQYDIRYIYPYTIPFIFLSAITLKTMLMAVKPVMKLIIWVFLIFMSMISIYQGLVGQINMYSSSLSGERKVWIEPWQLPLFFHKSTVPQIIDITFTNNQNYLIAVGVYSVGLSFIYLIKKMAALNKKNKALLPK